jgi:hypothetical protein
MKRADFMSSSQKAAMGDAMRTHQNCYDLTKVSRPGKTRHDKARNVWSSQNSRHGVREDVKTSKR